ncbi:F-box domain, FBD domain, Leucine-rich repeat domain, L domain-like protein [Artemisia annua]|uniref:F-box domain, FBD domain, Leucine-rich repeat domain, L domain-like protein n=1 Tax=Artemisia annua TaxID=35608 RepID=A0A2U1LN27_ARTAN|nr:F-box domain, FBD domain, Leucine-rich repeat domain, L domain-like protein [Artemisia annua]
MNKSKRANPSNLENDVDFISNMLDPILQLILQVLPNTEEVVRTSIISSRWRYLWTSIPYFPYLDIDCFRVVNPLTNFKKNNFEKFVSWALANKTVDLDKKWIEAASMRKVKKLDLIFCCDITMPVCLISCDSLEVFRLCLYDFTLHMRDCTWFRALKVLELNRIQWYKSDLPDQFIRMCPLLEELSLIECSRILINVPFRISSPKLKTLILHNRKKNIYGLTKYCSDIEIDCPELMLLEYVGPTGPLCLNSLDNLKKAVILPEDKIQQKISYQRGDNICETLAGMSHCIDAACDEEEKFPASFPNLKTLEVTTTIDAFTLKVLIQLLKCSPNLESLHLVIQKFSECYLLTVCLRKDGSTCDTSGLHAPISIRVLARVPKKFDNRNATLLKSFDLTVHDLDRFFVNLDLFQRNSKCLVSMTLLLIAQLKDVLYTAKFRAWRARYGKARPAEGARGLNIRGQMKEPQE